MSGPITWRNVSGPALPDVGRAMQAASVGFNGGFDILGKVIKDREAIDASNAVITQENAKNGFLDAVLCANIKKSTLPCIAVVGLLAEFCVGPGCVWRVLVLLLLLCWLAFGRFDHVLPNKMP